jgi:hypothetical protein
MHTTVYGAEVTVTVESRGEALVEFRNSDLEILQWRQGRGDRYYPTVL